VLRRVDVAGAGGVATRENASPGWAAEVDGREAAPKIFDGWRQGWTTPAAGDLELSFAPDRAYRAALLSGAVALGGLLAVTWVVRRRRRHAPEVRRRGRLPVLAHAGVLLVIAGLVAGNVGLAVALVGTAYAMALHHRAPEAGAWWLGAPLVATYAAYAVRPWGGAAGWAGQLAWPQLLVVLCLSAVAAWVWLDDERRGRPSRSAGRSTTR
jgi:arabinofuranan 3-O-arabinosyltransferase